MKFFLFSLIKNLKNKKYKWFFRLLFVVVLVLIIWGIVAYKNRPLCDKCNVILVSLDTLSALHLPCYGYERNTAPNLCKYAKENVLFLNSYSHTPMTLDSHFSIFTSLYPHTHKMTKLLENPLEEKYITLPQIYRNNGYQTIYHGTLSDLHLPLDRGIERGFNLIQGNSKLDSWNFAFEKFNESVVKKKPTFMFLHTYAVHAPYTTGHKEKHLFTDLPEYPNIPLTDKEFYKITPEFISFCIDYVLKKDTYLKKLHITNSDVAIAERLTQDKNNNETKSEFENLSPIAKNSCSIAWNDLMIDYNDPNQIEYLKALYDEQIFTLDQKLGELFDFLEHEGLSKSTVVVITSDHGEEFMEHGYLKHSNNLYRTSTFVPLIIHIPGVKPKKITEMVQGIDIYPTLLSLTGLKQQSSIEGISLLGIIEGNKNTIKNKYLLSEFNEERSVHVENLRLYYNDIYNSPIGLYDLNKDPQEQNNKSADYPKKIEELINLIN